MPYNYRFPVNSGETDILIVFAPYQRIRKSDEEEKNEKLLNVLQQSNKFDRLLSSDEKKLRQELLRKSLRLTEKEKVTALDREINELADKAGIPDLHSEKNLTTLKSDNKHINPYDWMDNEELYDICLAKSRIRERIGQCESLEKIQIAWDEICNELTIYPEKYKKADISSSDIPKRIQEIKEELESRKKILMDFNDKDGWPRIVSHPNIRGGRPTIEGTRWVAPEIAGMVEIEGIEVMMSEFEGLTRPMIHAAQEFTKEHSNANQ